VQNFLPNKAAAFLSLFARTRRAPPLVSGRPTTSSRTGRTRSGAAITRGCARSSRNTIPRVCSFSITASAARTGVQTDSWGWT